MSAFLGPVHVTMYERILHQDGMSEALLNLSEAHGWTKGLRNAVDEGAPASPKEPLENVIDQSNIHGWLSERVAASEVRFSLIVGGILSEDEGRLGALQEVMKEMGRGNPLPPNLNAESAFQMIHERLLDGMPCDFPFNVIKADEDDVTWKVVNCPHGPYWQGLQFDGEIYYLLRDAWLEGALAGSGMVHSREGDEHVLRRGQ